MLDLFILDQVSLTIKLTLSLSLHCHPWSKIVADGVLPYDYTSSWSYYSFGPENICGVTYENYAQPDDSSASRAI